MKVVDIKSRLTADEVLENAKTHYKDVVILGYNHDDMLEAFSSSGMVHKDKICFLLEQFKHKLLTGEW